MNRFWTVLFVVASTVCIAFADGTMFRDKSTLANPMVPAVATIPTQRAVIKWEDGVQTMLVESSIKGPAGVYGWVIPLPAKPSFVKAVNPTYISSTFQSVQPPVKYTKSPDQRAYAIPAALAVLILLTTGFRHRQKPLKERVAMFVIETTVAIFALGILLPIVGKDRTMADGFEGAAGAAIYKEAAMDKAKAMTVESLGTIGSYDVNVISGTDSAAILEWLREKNFAVPNNAKEAIDSYVKDGWVFLASKIRKDRNEPWPAHPLKAVFPSDKPVYPMRLTGTQTEPLRLELIVVGDGRAEVKPLEGWSCRDDGITIPVAMNRDLEKEVYADWKNGLYAMAKYGKAVTYLRADLKPEQMKEDYKIDWKPYEAFRVEAWEPEAANTRAWEITTQWLALGGFLIAIAGVLWPERFLIWIVAGPLASIGIATGIAWSWWSKVPKVDMIESYPMYGEHYQPVQMKSWDSIPISPGPR